jgi:hypothetical protein
MTSREQYIEGVKNGKKRNGKRLLIAFLEGERLSPQQAIRAHCYGCQGFYSDGAEDCLSDICPLRPFMPYNPDRVKTGTGRPGGNADALRKWRENQGAGDDEDYPDDPDFDEDPEFGETGTEAK